MDNFSETMKNKNNKNPEPEVAEINGVHTIRDILVGDFIAESKATFAKLDQQIRNSGQEQGADLKNLEKAMNDRLNAMDKAINQHFAKLEKSLQESVDKLNGRIDQVSKSDKKDLATMLATISQKLAKE